MTKGKRIGLALMAWVICHFGLHILSAFFNYNPAPTGIIALVSLGVAWTVFYSTKQKAH